MTISLAHVTSSANLQSIRRKGLNANTCLSASESLTDYYAETVEDDGDTPVTLGIELSSLDASLLMPDINGIEEPIMSVVRAISGCRDEEALYDAWMNSNQDFKASLDLIGSVVYSGAISPHLVSVIDENTGEWKPLISKERAHESPSPGF